MSEPLKRLPPNALLALASTLDELAAESRALGEAKSHVIERRSVARRKAELADAAGMVEAYADHMSLERAIGFVAEMTGFTVESIAWHVRSRAQERERRSLFERDRRIMRLARKGYTNAEIGTAVGLHPNSVSRIIRAALKAGAARSPSEKPADPPGPKRYSPDLASNARYGSIDG